MRYIIVCVWSFLIAAPTFACTGDCDGDGRVLVDEIVLGVSQALGTATLDTCSAADGDGDGRVTVDEILAAINAALAGCRAPVTRAFIIATDFETGSFATVRLANRTLELAAAPRRMVNGDAMVRVFDGRVFIVNRFGLDGDAIQELDPQDGFAERWNCSTGAGTNPHDIALVSPTKAYVTLYETTELLIVDPSIDAKCQGFVRGRIDLAEFADADGIPEMDSLVIDGGTLYVSLQRLDRNDLFSPVAKGMIIAIDTESDTVLEGIEMIGHNPFRRLVIDDSRLLVAATGAFTVADGGIEAIDLAEHRSLGFIVSESELGGDITDFEITDGSWYAVLSDDSFRNSVVAFDLETKTVTDILVGDSGFIAQIRATDDGQLYVADRNVRDPGIRVFDMETREELTNGPIDLGLPPFDMVFIE